MVRVSDVRLSTADDRRELQAWVSSERDAADDSWFAPFALWYRFPMWCGSILRADNGDPFLAALLLAAMRAGERLIIESPVSSRLLAALPEIQAIYAAFDPQANPILVETDGRLDDGPTGDRVPAVGLFFSLGVDSFYSLLKNRRDHPRGERAISHLIFVHGFETAYAPWDEDVSEPIRDNLHRVGVETGATALPVETNMQRVLSPLAPWTMAHGGGLASVALALGDMVGRVHIAATTTYDRLYPWGTHPVLDPLWSTERLAFVHDGCEIHVIDKTAFVARSPLALETLRVCPGVGPEYNCGRCPKCLRTMIDLTLAGALDDCQTLPHAIDATRLHDALRIGVSSVHIPEYGRRLRQLEAVGAPIDVCEALRSHLARLQVEDGHTRRVGPVRRFVRRWRRRIADWG